MVLGPDVAALKRFLSAIMLPDWSQGTIKTFKTFSVCLDYKTAEASDYGGKYNFSVSNNMRSKCMLASVIFSKGENRWMLHAMSQDFLPDAVEV